MKVMAKIFVVLLCYLLSAPGLIASMVFWIICPLVPIALIFHFILCLYWILEKPINKMLVRIAIFCIILSFLCIPTLSSISAKSFSFDSLLIFIVVEIFFTLPCLCLLSYIIEKKSADEKF